MRIDSHLLSSLKAPPTAPITWPVYADRYTTSVLAQFFCIIKRNSSFSLPRVFYSVWRRFNIQCVHASPRRAAHTYSCYYCYRASGRRTPSHVFYFYFGHFPFQQSCRFAWPLYHFTHILCQHMNGDGHFCSEITI